MFQFLAGYKEEMDEWIAAVNKESKFSGFSSPSIDLPPTPETHAKDGAGAPGKKTTLLIPRVG